MAGGNRSSGNTIHPSFAAYQDAQLNVCGSNPADPAVSSAVDGAAESVRLPADSPREVRGIGYNPLASRMRSRDIPKYLFRSYLWSWSVIPSQP